MFSLFKTGRFLPIRSFPLRMASSEVVVSFKEVCYEYVHEKPIITDANFGVRAGTKVTIMGQNGSGKSTIIKLINGTYHAHSGTINVKRGTAIATAMQVMPRDYRELTVKEFFTKQLHGVTSGIDSRISIALNTVQLVAPHDRLIKSFSGGQQARLLLASALALEPDVLLLDEPTNNLDVAGIAFLTEFLQTTDKTCIVISHDEHFLNAFSDSVLYLDVFSKKVEQYDGDYNTVKQDIADRIRKENMDNARLLKAAQAKKEQAGSFANKGGQMRKVAQKMREVAAQLESEVVDVRREDSALKNFVIPFSQNNDVKGTGSTLMTISEVVLPGVTHQSLPLAGGPVLIQAGMHVRIRGPNGVGKTTLLESIAHNRLAGVTINPKVKIGYYRQDFDNLDFDATVIEQLNRAASGRMPEQELRKMSGSFFLGPLANQKIVTLSEGQKGLVALCSLVLQQPGILIMDEPTNHINFRHLPALAKALTNFQGALLLVSHDADFVKKVRIDHEIDLEWELKQHTKGGNKGKK